MTEACHHSEDATPALWDGNDATMYCVVCWPDPDVALHQTSLDLIGSDGPPLDRVEHHREVMFEVVEGDDDDVAPLGCTMHSEGSGEHRGEWWFFPHPDIWAWDEIETGRRLAAEDD